MVKDTVTLQSYWTVCSSGRVRWTDTECHRGSQLDSSKETVTICIHEVRHHLQPGATQGTSQGLTLGLRSSSWNLTAVRALLINTKRSVQSPLSMPPHITDPNRSCWMMLQAGRCTSRHRHTLSHLSHVLSVNDSHLWGKQSASGEPGSSGVVWWKPIKLLGVSLWAYVLPQDTGLHATLMGSDYGQTVIIRLHEGGMTP